ncbi:hypothetical protein ACOMHN_042532 [Nucella lapillus]
MKTILQNAEEAIEKHKDNDNLILSPGELEDFLKDDKDDGPIVDSYVIEGLFNPHNDVTGAGGVNDDGVEIVQETLERLIDDDGDADDVMEDVALAFMLDDDFELGVDT